MLDYLVLYESETGNTKKLATRIFSALPGMAKDLMAIGQSVSLPEAAVYFIGFCVHHGTCSIEVGNVLGSLSGKDVALYGTCGLGDKELYKSIENSANIWLEDDNRYLGAFFCQGKMPLKIRQKFEAMIKEQSCDADMIRRQLHNFDEAMIHPSEDDLQQAEVFIKDCLGRVRKMP